jgi:hypothetical protein
MMTPFKKKALQALAGTHIHDTRSATSLSIVLWPEKHALCGTSRRRVALARAAGGYYSKLMKQGLVGFWMDDFDRGYYIKQKGADLLKGLAND